MPEEMWDTLPKKGEGWGCIFGTIIGIALGGLIIFLAYSVWEAFWDLGGTGKIWFLQALVLVIGFVIYQAYKMDKEVNNGTKP